jgi:hypothetical protein
LDSWFNSYEVLKILAKLWACCQPLPISVLFPGDQATFVASGSSSFQKYPNMPTPTCYSTSLIARKKNIAANASKSTQNYPKLPKFAKICPKTKL